MPLTDDPWLAYNTDGSVSPFQRAAPVGVFRYDGVSSLFALPNVQCVGIQHREGTDPGSATFRYNLASGIDGAPISIETALSTAYSGPYVVNVNDRLVVQASRPDGTVECLFDGLAVDFGMGLDPDNEEVQIRADGIAVTAFDNVIPGALTRNAGAARVIYDTPTDLIAQFNPEGLPNCTPDGCMAGSQSNGSDFRYPTFLDPRVVQQPTDARTYWTLPKACRYILFNPAGPLATNAVPLVYPDGAYLDSLLVTPSINGGPPKPINCYDTPISNKDWPGTIHRLVSELGFGTAFMLSTVGGLPKTNFNIFANQSGAVKSLYLAPRGSDFDATTCNFNQSRIGRDVSDVVNQQTIMGGPHRWEASFILAPGFPMQASDSSEANLINFDANNDAFIETNRNLYRLYIFDECSEGHYPVGSSTVSVIGSSLDGLFGQGQYARRRRPGIGTLISTDPLTNRAFNARLSISTNYDTANTKGPGLWDGTGTWQNIEGGWRLLHDRLGIEITDGNPNRWIIGPTGTASKPIPAGIVYGVERQATFVAGSSFVLRLTCVVEADQSLMAVASTTGNSPVARVINRVTDASDRFYNEYVDYPSEFNSTGGNDLNPRDNNAAALAEAQALQAQTEIGVLDGPVTIPRLTTYYQIGDLISNIEGRNLGLLTGASGGTPTYPVVVGVSYNLGDSQTTTLELSDAGSIRRRYRRPSARGQGLQPHESGGSNGPDSRNDRTGYEKGYMNKNKAAPGGYQPDPNDTTPSPWG